MENINIYPLRFQPIYKDYIWGGNKIAAHYKRGLPPGTYAESWEIADRPEGMSLVANGPLAGRDLFSLMQSYGEKLTGRQFDEFPLLIKLIDAKEKLSVQVHPDEAGVKEVGGDPKSEMWYVLDAEPQAKVYVGLKPGTNPASLKDALKKGKAGEFLQTIPVTRGDVIYIPGGRIHAIGPGCLLLEVQQSSNTTFRLFDWNRFGQDGKPRALQINKAFKVIRWKDPDLTKIDTAKCPTQSDGDGNTVAELLNVPFFRFEKITVTKSLSCTMDGKTFHALFVDAGFVELSWGTEKMPLESGMTVLIPAALASYCLTSGGGLATVLRVSLP
jgi:mannose-6-phosphate isomerase